MNIPNLRSPYEKVGGLYHFGRMLDKIRLHAEGKLPEDYVPNLGIGFDGQCIRFLRVHYADVVERVKAGGTDEEVFAWCCLHGHQPTEWETTVWNAFMGKRGWNDEASARLRERVAAYPAFAGKKIETFFDLIEAEEDRL
ncbi:MAG: DUF5069 domain-containing protein [Chthoniobacteraceae bacterium]|nr:DUF5069 domain-containing protein [Chthoniobacteraceae bacterium]